MLKIPFIELIIRGIPEGILIMWACYFLSKTKIELNRYLFSIIASIFICYVVRNLPINLGVNTLLIIGLIIIINIKINKISIIKSIRVSFIVFILEFVCEIINMIMIKYLFKADLTHIFSNSYLKTLYGIPSLILFVLFTILLNILLNKRSALDK